MRVSESSATRVHCYCPNQNRNNSMTRVNNSNGKNNMKEYMIKVF